MLAGRQKGIMSSNRRESIELPGAVRASQLFCFFCYPKEGGWFLTLQEQGGFVWFDAAEERIEVLRSRTADNYIGF